MSNRVTLNLVPDISHPYNDEFFDLLSQTKINVIKKDWIKTFRIFMNDGDVVDIPSICILDDICPKNFRNDVVKDYVLSNVDNMQIVLDMSYIDAFLESEVIRVLSQVS